MRERPQRGSAGASGRRGSTPMRVAGCALLPALLALVSCGTRCEGRLVVTLTRITELSAGLETVARDRFLGHYPRADHRRPEASNDLNLGIEAVYLALRVDFPEVRRAGSDEWLANLDGDRRPAGPPGDAPTELMEFVDQWGNPLAYFSASDYEDPGPVSKYRMADGRIATAMPHRSERTGLPLNPGTCQLFSAGEDWEFNTEDDLGNW